MDNTLSNNTISTTWLSNRECSLRDAPDAGFELPLLLLSGFRSLIDDLHEELARQGHPDVRPAHGFALQAMAAGPLTAADLGRRLGVSKQAAGKTIDRLTECGYLRPHDAGGDARRRAVRLTDAGADVLRRSATIFSQLYAEWDIRTAGRVGEVTEILRAAVGPAVLRTDAAGWFG